MMLVSLTSSPTTTTMLEKNHACDHIGSQLDVNRHTEKNQQQQQQSTTTSSYPRDPDQWGTTTMTMDPQRSTRTIQRSIAPMDHKTLLVDHQGDATSRKGFIPSSSFISGLPAEQLIRSDSLLSELDTCFVKSFDQIVELFDDIIMVRPKSKLYWGSVISTKTPCVVKVVQKVNRLECRQLRREYTALKCFHSQYQQSTSTSLSTDPEDNKDSRLSALTTTPSLQDSSLKSSSYTQQPLDTHDRQHHGDVCRFKARQQTLSTTCNTPQQHHCSITVDTRLAKRVVTPILFLETSTQVALVTERLDGPDLGQYLVQNRSGHLSEVEAKTVIRTVLEAIQAIHHSGFVHRDIKLSNLVFRHRNNLESLTLVDFGLSARLNDSKELFRFCGSPGSCAPEILLGYPGECPEKIDVFGLGIALFTLLTGRPPFVAASPPMILRLNCRALMSFNEPIWKTLPASVKNLTKRMTEKNPTYRISIAEALEHQWFISDS